MVDTVAAVKAVEKTPEEISIEENGIFNGAHGLLDRVGWTGLAGPKGLLSKGLARDSLRH